MKFLPLVWKNLFRRKVRTLFTVLSIVVAFVLFAYLAAIRVAFGTGVEVAGADRMLVIHKISLIQPLPESYLGRVASIVGVEDISHMSWFGGVYQDERNFFPQFAVDGPTYRAMFPEFSISEEQWQAFTDDREGCVVGVSLAERFGWKIGDRIPIRGTIYPGNWEFNIRAIYEGTRPQDDTSGFWFHWEYLNERNPYAKGYVGWYTVRIANPDDAVRVASASDQEFANSPFETKTETEKAFAASFVKQMGNIELLILSIGSVVFITLLLVSGNTTAIAIRERVRELAVLKAVGFSDAFVQRLVLAESLVVAVVGGGLGLALAKLFTLQGDPSGGLLPFFYLPPDAIVAGLALAIAIGVVSGAWPAYRARGLRVVDALRRV
jgi:putative ABC transport system permease protein